MKSKLEIIKETILHYTVEGNPRSVAANGKDCKYNGPIGEQCAFARVCKEEIPDKFEGYSSSRVLILLGFNILKDEYKILDEEFWDKIQSIHDFLLDKHRCPYFQDFCSGILSRFEEFVNLEELEDMLEEIEPKLKEHFLAM